MKSTEKHYQAQVDDSAVLPDPAAGYPTSPAASLDPRTPGSVKPKKLGKVSD